jgi:hypothetical protein
MTKANDLASLLDANGDVVSTALDNVPAAPTPSLSSLGIPNHDDITVDGSGSVGIGTALPNNRLQINGGAADTAFQITNSATGSTATDGFSITVENPTPDVVLRNREAAAMRFLTSNTERMRIDSSGNVGIGTSSPTYKVDVSGTNPALRLKSSAAFGYIIDQNTSSGLVSHIVYENVDVRFGTNSAERMRIDSSGNLLVGTTTNGTTADGTVIRAYGETLMTRSNGTPLLLNRRGTDGAVIEVRNDNSAVGYITANAGGMGVYLGGTGSANHLDDYEEGTWTPTAISTATDPTVTYNSSTAGRYTKVGNLVTFWFYLRLDSVSGGSGNLNIGGLPFTNANAAPVSEGHTMNINYYQNTNLSSGTVPTGYVMNNDNKIYITISGAGGNTTTYPVTSMSNGFNLFASGTLSVA